MPKIFAQVIENVKALAPKSLLTPEGWCFGVIYALQVSGFINEHEQYQKRFQGLGQDLAFTPITANNKVYYSFSELKQDYDELKLKKNLTSTAQDFVDGMNDVFDFIDTISVYLSPEKIKFMHHGQDAGKSFSLVMPLTLEKLSLDKDTKLLPIYHQPIKLSKSAPHAFMELLNEVNKLPNSNLMSFTVGSFNHTIAIVNVDKQWKIFDQNAITDKDFYQKLTMENLINAFNFTQTPADLTFCTLTAYASPITTTQADAALMKQKLEATASHKNLTTAFIKARDERGPEGLTPIEIANEENHLDIIKKLITPEIKNSNLAFKLLGNAIIADYPKLTQFYLDQNFPLEPTDGTQSMLQYAAEYGHKNMVETLLAHGAHANYQDMIKNTPLHNAAQHGYLDIVKTLLTKNNVALKNISGDTPLSLAVANGHLEVAEFLMTQQTNIKQFDKDNNTLIHKAAKSNDLNMMKLILEKDKKTSIFAYNKQNFKAIHYAVEHGNFELFKLLIDKGTILSHRDAYLLNVAAKSGSLPILEYLVQQQNLHIKDKDGKTPLHIAVESGHRDIVKYLLKEKVNIDVLDKEKNTPLHLAALHGNTTIAKLLIDHGASFTQKNKDGDSPLIQAAVNGYADIVQLLVTKGADVSECGFDGNTPLHCAAFFNNAESVNFLLSNGADINAHNSNHETPLQQAVYQGHAQLAFFLAAQGGSIDVTIEKNKISLYERIQNENTNPQAASILLEALASKNTLPKDVVLELSLININKTPWKIHHNIYHKEPETVRAIKKIIEDTRSQAHQNPTQAKTLWDKAFDDVIHKLTKSLNKKEDPVLGLFKRDPSTKQYYQDLLNLLKQYDKLSPAQKAKIKSPK